MPLRYPLLIAVTVSCSLPAQIPAGPVVRTAGNFAGWTQSSYTGQPGPSGSWSIGMGGNPGNAITVTNNLPGTNQVFYQFFTFPSLTWVPATDGPIKDIAFEIDVRSVTGIGSGQGIAPAVFQGGSPYLGCETVTGGQTTWHRMLFPACAEASFHLPGNVNTHPDFGVSGAPITFGFTASNGGTAYSQTQIYDNWEVTIRRAAAIVTLGQGCTTAGAGIPILAGTAPVLGQVMNETLSNLPSGIQGILYASLGPASFVSAGNGCFVYLNLATFFQLGTFVNPPGGLFGGGGQWELNFAVPQDPNLQGTQLTIQALTLNLASGAYAMSNAVHLYCGY